MIEGYVALWHKVIKFSDWEGRVEGGEDRDKLVFHFWMACLAALWKCLCGGMH